MEMLTIALAQLKGALYDKGFNLYRALSTIQTCKEKNVDYVIFPELFLSGFFIQDQVKDLAEPVDGPSIQAVRQKAKETGVGVIIGFPEVYRNRFYNSAAFIERDGSLAGVYRKIHLFDKEMEYFTSGEECPTFQTAAGRMAVMMTFDVEFPELSRIYAIQGTELILVLNAHSVPYEPHQEIFLRARALENQLFIAAANKVGLEKNSVFFGESAVITPDGMFLERGGNNEELIVTSLDLSDVNRVRKEHLMKYLENRQGKLYSKYGLA